MIAAYAWQEQAQASIVVDDLGVFDAARRGWQILVNNKGPLVLVSLVLYLGVSIVSGLIAMPIMIPFFVVPFVLIEEFENINIILLVASLCMLVYLPVLALFQAAALTFMKSGWMLTYLRLTRTSETDVYEIPAA